MAITRAQQVKQMLKQGGRTGFFLGSSYDIGGGGNPNKPTSSSTNREKGITSRGRGPRGTTGDIKDFKDTPVERPGNRYDTNVEDLLPGDEVDLQVDLDPKDPRRIKDKNKNLFITKPANYPKFTPSYLQIAANFNREPNRRFFYERVLKNNAAGLTYTQLEKEYDKYIKGRMSGETDAMGNLIPDTLRGDRDESILFPQGQGIMNQAPEDMDQETEDEFKLARAFRADGGRIGFFTAGLAAGDEISPGTAASSSKGGPTRRDNNQQTVTAPPTNVDGGGITTLTSKKNIPAPNTDISKFNVNDLINLGLVDPEDENTQLAKVFNTKEDLIGLGAAKDGFFDTLTPEGKALEKFRKSAVGFKKAKANTANTPQAALNFMQNKPGLFSDVLDNQEFIQSAIDKGFLKDESDYANQKPLGEAVDLRADGGRIGAAEGGIMDLETGRQMYFLGKLVKKATRAVKKIVKSPIGKAALIGGGLGLAGIGPFKGLASSPFGTGLTKNFLKFKGSPIGEAIFGKAQVDDMERTGGLLNFIKDNPFGAITAASTIAGLTAEQEEEAQQLADNTGIDIEEARNAILQAAKENYAMDSRARGFKADGGIMRAGYQEGSKEPVAKKTMPLLDMGGKEMDLREDGGFVPIGRMEKADDVPARLSKNEFVFTADAVRNAGDGNVDKGAEVMYNMMKNLESGGDVSEESQGLEGAREMFQTSQRLEEVL